MRTLITVLKLVFNIIVFCFYILISITIVNFLFGLIMVSTWKTVPGSQDPIHMALAIVTLWIVILITFVLRKYFYLSINRWKKQTQVEKDTQSNIWTSAENINKQEESSQGEEMKIYIDKEMK